MIPAKKIWLPGKGEVDPLVWKVNLAVKEYDERLSVGRNEESGEWCVFIKMPPGGDWPELFPVLGLGPQEPTDPEEVLRRIYKADTVRHGTKILNELNRGNDRRMKEKYDDPADEAAMLMAEVMDYAHRRTGTAPYSRVHMNGRTRRGYGEYW